MKSFRVDVGYLGKVRRTPQGGALLTAYVSQAKVLRYRNEDGTERREYVPPEELFRADSMGSLVTASLTEGHKAMVTPENYRELTRGTFHSPRQDGNRLAVETAVQDADTLKRVDTGELAECSAGYELDYDPTPGTTPEGEHYDGVQRNRVYNHVALLPSGGGRAGRGVGLRFDGQDASVCSDACYPENGTGNRTDEEPKETMAFRFDGKEYATAEAALEVASGAVITARKDATDAKAVASTAEARADAAEAQLEQAKDPAKIRAAVAARVKLERNAVAVLGKSYKCDGKDERAIMIDVIRADAKKFDATGRDDTYVTARYDSVIERGVRADGKDGLRAAITEAREETEEREDALEVPDVEDAQERLRTDMASAWKKPSVGAAGGAS